MIVSGCMSHLYSCHDRAYTAVMTVLIQLTLLLVLRRYAVPGMKKDDVDWAESVTLLQARVCLSPSTLQPQ